VGDHVEITGRPATQPRLALAAKADATAVVDAAGMFTRSRLTPRVAPLPWQVGQGDSITVPLPPQRVHGCEIENIPCPCDSIRDPRSGDKRSASCRAAPVPNRWRSARRPGSSAAPGRRGRPGRSRSGSRPRGRDRARARCDCAAPCLRRQRRRRGSRGCPRSPALKAAANGLGPRRQRRRRRRGRTPRASRVREDVVCLADLLETLSAFSSSGLRSGGTDARACGRLLDLLGRRLLVDAEDAVWIPARSHAGAS